MIFTRTSSGISNLYLFHGVEIVVFIEGGNTSYSYEEVCQGQAGAESPDIRYWRLIFQWMSPRKKITFKPVGSKGTLAKIAKDIQLGLVKNVFVAMDQDLCRFRGTQIISDAVFYSWGYSWENDLFHKTVIEEAVFMLCPIDRSSNEANVEADIDSAFTSLVRDIKQVVIADVIMSCQGGGLFDRKNWKKHVKSRSGVHGEPYIDTESLKDNINVDQSPSQKQLISKISSSLDTLRDCFGHLLCTFLYRLLLHLLKKYSGDPSLSLQNANSILIKITGDMLSKGSLSELEQHHTNQFAFLLS